MGKEASVFIANLLFIFRQNNNEGEKRWIKDEWVKNSFILAFVSRFVTALSDT